MRSHHDVNNKKCISGISLVDIKQIAMTNGKYVRENSTKLLEPKTFKIDHEVGLFTFEDLKKRFTL